MRAGAAPTSRLGWLAPVIAAAALAGCGWFGGDDRAGAPDAGSRRPATYYVDAARGRDSNAGTRPGAAWRTLARVDRASFRGGDAILLRGGQRFPGAIGLAPSNLSATSRDAVLTIGSYGRGRATILAPHRTTGIAVLNVAGVHVAGIDIVGRGNLEIVEDGYSRCRDGPAGIRFQARSISRTLDAGITIDHVDVSRFCAGIVVASADDGSGIARVRIANVRAHDNGDAGVLTHDRAQAKHLIEDVTVTDAWAYRNGDRGGIVLFGVDGGTVRDSVAFANATGGEGGVGIWAFDSNRIHITHNESYRNGSPAIEIEGDGFDLDRGVSNSVMEHNYSHDNGGIGFLVCSCERWGRFYRMHDNVVRFNVSRNDGSSGQPSLHVRGGEPMRDIDIVSNRVVSGAGSGPLVDVDSNRRRYSDVRFQGNTFIAQDGKQLLEVVGPGDATRLTFQANTWRASDGRFRVDWGNRRFLSPTAWRAANRRR